MLPLGPFFPALHQPRLTNSAPGWGELAVTIITEHPATAIIFVGSQLTIVLLGVAIENGPISC